MHTRPLRPLHRQPALAARLVRRSPSHSEFMCSSACRATSEAVAADDIEDDVEDGNEDLREHAVEYDNVQETESNQ